MLIRLATRTSSKVIATAFGIALCVMFLSGSMSLLGGLQSSTAKVAERFDEGPILAYASLPLESGRVESSTLHAMENPFCAVRVVRVNISYGGALLQETFGASASNGTFLRASLTGLDDGEIWVGAALLDAARQKGLTLPSRASLNVASQSANLTLAYERVHPSTLLPDDWVLVSEHTLMLLAPSLAQDATFLLVGENSNDLPYLRAKGFTTVPTLASVDFFRQGVDSLEPALWGLAVAVGAIACLLTFTLMALDVRYRAREIKTMRQIGASRGFVVNLVLLRSVYVSSLGALLGLALGSIVTNAVTSFSPLAGMSTFVLPAPSVFALALPAMVAIVAGVVGGLVPAAGAARIRTVPGAIPR